MFIKWRTGNTNQWLDSSAGIKYQQRCRARWLQSIRPPKCPTPDYVIDIIINTFEPFILLLFTYFRDMETFIHLLKGSLGSGILAMPMAFMNAGLVFGLIATATIGFVCTYCVHILVNLLYLINDSMSYGLMKE